MTPLACFLCITACEKTGLGLQQRGGRRGFITFLQREDPSLAALTIRCKHIEYVVIVDDLEGEQRESQPLEAIPDTQGMMGLLKETGSSPHTNKLRGK